MNNCTECYFEETIKCTSNSFNYFIGYSKVTALSLDDCTELEDTKYYVTCHIFKTIFCNHFPIAAIKHCTTVSRCNFGFTV